MSCLSEIDVLGSLEGEADEGSTSSDLLADSASVGYGEADEDEGDDRAFFFRVLRDAAVNFNC